ncbi:hypothetical protein [Streptomyces ossamyceticus]|uniref:hypothetical protein n=1 Tax=Streptomyces ossamyceticus TaxID=249581 RepID=UPI00342852E6
MMHDPTLVVEIRELLPEDGWARYEDTGRATVACSCGLNTGWIPKTEAARIAQDHPTAPKGTAPMPQPSIGRIVHVAADPSMNNGADIAPAVITRVWSDTVVNVRVLLDGDSAPQWRTSLTHTDTLDDVADDVRLSRWTWPPRT